MPAPVNPQGQGRVAFLPFTRISLKSLIQKPYDFEPRMLGDHIRKRRLKLGLIQRDVAEKLGVSAWTVLNWEKGHTEPPVRAIPAIIRFLGYDPFPPPISLPQQLLAKRRKQGWSINEAASHCGVDEGTWRQWELGRTILYRQHREMLSKILAMPVEDINTELANRLSLSHRSKK